MSLESKLKILENSTRAVHTDSDTEEEQTTPVNHSRKSNSSTEEKTVTKQLPLRTTNSYTGLTNTMDDPTSSALSSVLDPNAAEFTRQPGNPKKKERQITKITEVTEPKHVVRETATIRSFGSIPEVEKISYVSELKSGLEIFINEQITGPDRYRKVPNYKRSFNKFITTPNPKLKWYLGLKKCGTLSYVDLSKVSSLGAKQDLNWLESQVRDMTSCIDVLNYCANNAIIVNNGLHSIAFAHLTSTQEHEVDIIVSTSGKRFLLPCVHQYQACKVEDDLSLAYPTEAELPVIANALRTFRSVLNYHPKAAFALLPETWKAKASYKNMTPALLPIDAINKLRVNENNGKMTKAEKVKLRQDAQSTELAISTFVICSSLLDDIRNVKWGLAAELSTESVGTQVRAESLAESFKSINRACIAENELDLEDLELLETSGQFRFIKEDEDLNEYAAGGVTIATGLDLIECYETCAYAVRNSKRLGNVRNGQLKELQLGTKKFNIVVFGELERDGGTSFGVFIHPSSARLLLERGRDINTFLLMCFQKDFMNMIGRQPSISRISQTGVDCETIVVPTGLGGWVSDLKTKIAAAEHDKIGNLEQLSMWINKNSKSFESAAESIDNDQEISFRLDEYLFQNDVKDATYEGCRMGKALGIIASQSEYLSTAHPNFFRAVEILKQAATERDVGAIKRKRGTEVFDRQCATRVYPVELARMLLRLNGQYHTLKSSAEACAAVLTQGMPGHQKMEELIKEANAGDFENALLSMISIDRLPEGDKQVSPMILTGKRVRESLSLLSPAGAKTKQEVLSMILIHHDPETWTTMKKNFDNIITIVEGNQAKINQLKISQGVIRQFSNMEMELAVQETLVWKALRSFPIMRRSFSPVNGVCLDLEDKWSKENVERGTRMITQTPLKESTMEIVNTRRKAIEAALKSQNLLSSKGGTETILSILT